MKFMRRLLQGVKAVAFYAIFLIPTHLFPQVYIGSDVKVIIDEGATLNIDGTPVECNAITVISDEGDYKSVIAENKAKQKKNKKNNVVKVRNIRVVKIAEATGLQSVNSSNRTAQYGTGFDKTVCAAVNNHHFKKWNLATVKNLTFNDLSLQSDGFANVRQIHNSTCCPCRPVRRPPPTVL
jgi:hypothetical protein